MPAPRMISTTGSALTADEMSFAWRVFASFSVDMKRGWVKVIRRQDPVTGTIVEYHADKDIAYVTPGGATDYVMVAMPNPVPYRGVSIGVVTDASNVTKTYVMASDGTVLASEVQNSAGVNPTITQYTVGDTVWDGGSNVWMFQTAENPEATAFDHKLLFTVPEDCIYPTPPSVSTSHPPVFMLTHPGVQVPVATRNAWILDMQAGLTALNTRRKAWFKKNSDEFIAALKTGFALGTPGVTRAELKTGSLPASWDYLIKRDVDVAYNTYSADATVGQHTKMPIVMSITSAPDVVVSDTSANLTQAGTKVTRRTTTFAYTDVAGVAWSVAVDGTLTQIVTVHVNSVGTHVAISHRDTYLNWYDVDEAFGVGVFRYARQFIRDQAFTGIGQLFNGIIQNGDNADSTWSTSPSNPINRTGYIPAYPTYSSTLVGTAPDIFLQYHNTVKPVYVSDAAQASTVMNNSAMYGVTKVELTPVGLIANGVGTAAAGESVGIFSASEDGTQIEIYGTAVYNFNWQTGSLTFANWKPLHDVNGLEVASKTINLPQGVVWSSIGINCLATYRGLHWPDIIRAISVRNSSIPTAVNPEDRVLGALMDAVKAG